VGEVESVSQTEPLRKPVPLIHFGNSLRSLHTGNFGTVRLNRFFSRKRQDRSDLGNLSIADESGLGLWPSQSTNIPLLFGCLP
jgi:hypothetical protein